MVTPAPTVTVMSAGAYSSIRSNFAVEIIRSMACGSGAPIQFCAAAARSYQHSGLVCVLQHPCQLSLVGGLDVQLRHHSAYLRLRRRRGGAAPSTTIERRASRACAEVAFANPGIASIQVSLRKTVPLQRFRAGAERMAPASPRTTEYGETSFRGSIDDRDRRRIGPAAWSASQVRRTSRT